MIKLKFVSLVFVFLIGLCLSVTIFLLLREATSSQGIDVIGNVVLLPVILILLLVSVILNLGSVFSSFSFIFIETGVIKILSVMLFILSLMLLGLTIYNIIEFISLF